MQPQLLGRRTRSMWHDVGSSEEIYPSFNEAWIDRCARLWWGNPGVSRAEVGRQSNPPGTSPYMLSVRALIQTIGPRMPSSTLSSLTASDFSLTTMIDEVAGLAKNRDLS